MMRVSSKASTTLSLILSVVFFVAVLFGAAIMPVFVNIIVSGDIVSGGADIFPKDKLLILIIAYIILALALIADILLFVLLLRVRAELVFTKQSISLIRGVSYCALAVGGMFAVLGYYFKLAIVVGAAAVFLGICLRVVKNVIEKATEIKDENDLTV